MTRRPPPARQILLPASGHSVDAETEALFFRGLRLANGTYKATEVNRLTDLDALVGQHLPPPGLLRVLDAAASTGVTSLDWLDRLEQHQYHPSLTIADLAIDAWLYRVGPLDLLLDRQGHVLQVALGRRTIFRPDPAVPGLRPRLLTVLIGLLERLAPAEPLRHARTRPVRLVSPRLIGRDRVRVVERDLTQPCEEWRGSFDVVRVANFLNLSYFDHDTLRRLARHLVETVVPCGLLVVCRTDAMGINNGSIFRVPSSSGVPASVLARVGQGSEVEGLVLEVIHESRSLQTLSDRR